MSLKVWLPLNGTLNNLGTSNITFTGNPVWRSPGKIGNSAYNLSTRVNFNCPALAGVQYFSIAFWGMTEANTESTANWMDLLGFTDKSVSGTTGSFRFETGYGNTAYGGIHWHDNTTNAIINGAYTYNTASEYGNWHHIVVTVSNTAVCSYYDGVLKSTLTANLNGGSLTGAGWIGESTTRGGIQDIRVYDHCLSAAEVHEISQGLILHYKLDNEYFMAATNQLGEKSDHFSGWGSYGFGSHGQTTVVNIPPALSGQVGQVINKDNGNYDGEIATAISGYNLNKNESITFSAYVKGNGNTIGKTGHIWIYKSNGTNTISTGTSFIFTADWQRVKHTITWTYDNPGTSATSCYVRCKRAQNESFYISNCQLESGTIATGFTNGSRSIENMQDSSGYGYNGTIVGTPTINSNSVRYRNSIYLDTGVNSRIVTPSLTFDPRCVTLSIWFKSTSTSPTGGYHMVVDSNVHRQWYEMAVYSTGYFRGGLFVNGTRRADNGTSTNCLNGNWHMLTLTYDGTNVNRYVDGVMEKATAAAYSTGLSSPTALTLGRDGPNATYAVKEAYLSDFRVYCTALSASDVLQLYHTSAKIDNRQNLHSFELVEAQTSISINKRGQVLCNEIEEDTATKFYKTNSIIETNEIIEF